MQRNELKPKKSLRIITFITIIFLISAIILLTQLENKVSAISIEPSKEQILRFGITIPYLTGDYVELVNQINARAVLDWRTDDNNEWAEHKIDYLHVIRVSDAAYNHGAILDTLPDLIQNNLGEVWIIGNEPDRDIQDGITPEVYAQRYYELAIRIRYLDPTAKLGFGSVVQPTPIRIRYLERALDHLTYLSCGNREAALDLIDIWSIHAFILNEIGSWGASIPVGFSCPIVCFENQNCPEYCYDAERITNYADTYSIEIFNKRLIEFREWMAFIGEKEKPLWITEYGSLFPDWEIVCIIYHVSCNFPINGWPTEYDSYEFMIKTFDYLISTSNSEIGFNEDNSQLVQRWFWYSLNGIRNDFGGTLFDPDENHSQTLAGQGYESYTNQILLNSSNGINPVLFRKDSFSYTVDFNELEEKYLYPYEYCFRTQLPLVLK